MRIFLTGASGLVGSNLIPRAKKRGHEIIAVKGSWPGAIPGVDQLIQLDLTDLESVQAKVLDLFPDAIINAAGVTEPALCDRDPEGSRRLNVELPELLARLAHHLSGRLVHFSSDQVFGGSNAPFRADSPPCPLNLYGKQKVESETRVREAAPEHAVVLRLPLLNGNSLSGHRSLHERLFGLWSRGEPARLYRDEIRQPAGADNVAAVAVELCERNDLQGIHNWAGSEPLSRLEIGLGICRHFGLPEDLVIPADRADHPGAERRPGKLTMDLTGLTGILKTSAQDFPTQLDNLVVPRPCRDWFNSLGSP